MCRTCDGAGGRPAEEPHRRPRSEEMVLDSIATGNERQQAGASVIRASTHVEHVQGHMSAELPPP
jgi:hypothetical protein